MRILFMTNLYPPHELGGQGYSCQQVVEGMQSRGHATLVLTSMHGTNNTQVYGNGVYRALFLEMDLVPWRAALTFFTWRSVRQKHNLQVVRQVVEEFAPDVIFIWGMWNVDRNVPALAEQLLPGRVLYRFADYWPMLPSQHEYYWHAPGQTLPARLLKRVLGRIALFMLARETPPSLRFEHTICVSAAVRRILVEAGVPVADARLIYTGIDAQQFAPDGRKPQLETGLHLLYAGRLSADKGVETAIYALAELRTRGVRVLLTLAGTGDPQYQAYLQSLVLQQGVEPHVTFVGLVPREEMPRLMQRHHVLLVPSTWQEPLARVALEGMSAGLVVVATPTGGTAEIIQHEQNGLLFAPGDASDLAAQVAQLAADKALQERLAYAGTRTVIEGFTVPQMMDAYEAYLQEVAGCVPAVYQDQGVLS